MAEEKYVVGYYRLSMEDDSSDAESNSIVNQRLLVRDYISGDLALTELPFKEFFDDGYSGASMERPGMQELLDLVRMEQVAGIVVKDFSRFSRDYIELGTYLEQIFPFMEVRFIAITDHYDSDDFKGKTLDTDAQFKSLLNDFYVKDQSVKVKTAVKTRRENGEYACGIAPFGYSIDTKKKRTLVIIEEEAEIIRRIFELTLQRYSKQEICRALNSEGICTPAEIMRKRGCVTSKNNVYKAKKWSVDMVRRILNSKTNYGCMVYGKTKILDPGTGKEIMLPNDEWQVMENHHVPIVSRETFEKAQRLQRRNSNVRKGRSLNRLLTSYVKCGKCGRVMAGSKVINGHYFYSCTYSKADEHTECFRGKIDNMILENMILVELKRQIQSKVDRADMEAQMRKQHKELLEDYKKEIQTNEQEIVELKEKHRKNYEIYQQGDMERETLLEAKEQLRQRRKQCEERIQELQEYIAQEKAILSKQVMPKEQLLEYLGFEKLSREMVEEYLSEIRIYDDGRIEMDWKL